MEDNQIPYTLIAKYFSGQTSSEEKDTLEKWRNFSTENERVFKQLCTEWESLPSLSSYVIPDKEIMWKRIVSSIGGVDKWVQKSYSRRILIQATTVAAVIALMFGFTVSYFLSGYSSSVQQTTCIALPGQKSKIVLPDSTVVWLNSGSELTYTSDFNSRLRTVTLQGEGYFEVTKDMRKQFVVKTANIDVVVHGTSFNVQAYPEEDTSVSLISGSVSLVSQLSGKELAQLHPGEKALLQNNNLLLSGCDTETDAVWHLNKLRFESAGTGELFKKLGRWYGVNIEVSGNVKNDLYWFTVKTESLKEILESINKITPITYEIKGEEVSIRYR